MISSIVKLNFSANPDLPLYLKENIAFSNLMKECIMEIYKERPITNPQIKQIITTKLGWEPQKGRKTTWHTDCLLHPFMNYCFFKLFGCSKDCFGYGNMINSGEMDRDEALKQEEAMAATYTDNIHDLLENTIGLPEKLVSDIESFPSKYNKI